MADEPPPEEEPLLVEDQAGAWDDIEDGSARNPATTVQQLIAQVRSCCRQLADASQLLAAESPMQQRMARASCVSCPHDSSVEAGGGGLKVERNLEVERDHAHAPTCPSHAGPGPRDPVHRQEGRRQAGRLHSAGECS